MGARHRVRFKVAEVRPLSPCPARRTSTCDPLLRVHQAWSGSLLYCLRSEAGDRACVTTRTLFQGPQQRDDRGDSTRSCCPVAQCHPHHQAGQRWQKGRAGVRCWKVEVTQASTCALGCCSSLPARGPCACQGFQLQTIEPSLATLLTRGVYSGRAEVRESLASLGNQAASAM